MTQNPGFSFSESVECLPNPRFLVLKLRKTQVTDKNVPPWCKGLGKLQTMSSAIMSSTENAKT